MGEGWDFEIQGRQNHPFLTSWELSAPCLNAHAPLIEYLNHMNCYKESPHEPELALSLTNTQNWWPELCSAESTLMTRGIFKGFSF